MPSRKVPQLKNIVILAIRLYIFTVNFRHITQNSLLQYFNVDNREQICYICSVAEMYDILCDDFITNLVVFAVAQLPIVFPKNVLAAVNSN